MLHRNYKFECFEGVNHEGTVAMVPVLATRLGAELWLVALSDQTESIKI